MASVEIISGTSGDELKQRLRSITEGFSNTMTNRLLDVAEKESKFTARILKTTAISKEELASKVLNENMRLNLASQEKTRKSISTAFSQFSRRKADEINQIIKDGRALGLTNVDIMKNVDERINGLHTTQARTLSHTATLYTSNVAQRETIKQASSKVVFTLGESTDHTDFCLGLEGQIFNTEDAPTPPLHWGCNSYLVPIEDKGE